jgi:23S rRNA pseudouridine2604 synthase
MNTPANKGTRINKYLAEHNYATRTGADELIKKGLVSINGRLAVLGDKVNTTDVVVVKFKAGKGPASKSTPTYTYYAYNKPVGISTNPEVNCKDILTTTKFPEKVFPIGRLDKDSHGLIIMTSDGRVTDRLLSPKYVHEKEYVVKLEKEYTERFLENMQNGVHFDKFVSAACKAWPASAKATIPTDNKQATKTKTKDIKKTFHIILTEGKKRQIRRMCEALYHKVVDLQRIRVMNIELGTIPVGEYREIKGEELNIFLKSLKLI